jgi:hypothetical protein
LTALVVAAGLGGTPLLAQQPGQGMPCRQGMQGAQAMQHRQDMQKMHARMQERDQQLERQLAKVDSVRGDAKVKALTEAVRMMAADRREMHQHMQEHMKQMEQGGCPGPAGTGPHGPHPMPGRATGE